MPQPQAEQPLGVQSWPPRFLRWLAHSIHAHPARFLYPQIFLAVLCIWYTAHPAIGLKFKAGRNDLVGTDKLYHANYLKFLKEFPNQDDLVVVVESDDLEKNRQFVERLGTKLEARTDLFEGVFYRNDLAMLGPKALLFASTNDLVAMRDSLRSYRPILLEFSSSSNLISVVDLINRKFRSARRERNDDTSSLIQALPSLERIILQATDALRRSGDPPPPGVSSLFEGGERAASQMYLTFQDGRVFLVTAQARSKALESQAVDQLRSFIEQTQLEVPGLNVGLTGEPVLQLDELTQSKDDTAIASILSLIAVALIFIYGYHETGRPLKATFCLLVGLAYTMAFTTFTIGHLNILTVTFVPILIGLAIDFGVHLITRYEEELRYGETERVALERAMVNTGMGISNGAFTTASAFLAMAITDFKGIREMGIICGGGLLVCLVPMLTLLPSMLMLGRQNLLDHELAEALRHKAAREIAVRNRIELVWLKRPWLTLSTTLVLALLSLFPARQVRFDYNLLNMQSRGLAAVIYQEKLLHSSSRSLLFGAVVASTLTQATNLEAQLKQLDGVASVDSMSSFLSQDHRPKFRLQEEIKAAVADIQFPPVDTAPLEFKELDLRLWILGSYLRFGADATKESDLPLSSQLDRLRRTVSEFRSTLLRVGPDHASHQLVTFQQALLKDLRRTFEVIQTQKTREGLKTEDLPEALRKRFIGISGKYLLQVYPKEDLWERAGQADFVAQLRTVDAAATGTPVQLYEYTTLLKQSFEEAALYSLAAITLLIWIQFRRFACVVFALIPVGLGFLITFALMGLTGTPFNPANIMTLPLTVGIGVTNGVHILTRFAEERHPAILGKSTGKAVLVSGLTTIAGFSSLIPAKHQGIQSLGILMSVSVAACMIVAMTFLPALLNIMHRHGWTIKKTQCDNAQSTLGREEPR